ncbi:MAG: sugar phosphate nucleotidyltransferase [Leptospirales bacterium]|jgi:UDP-N-acetylglucosamine pyrophosphorylase
MAISSKDAKAAVVLAAGKGTRMKSDLPKVAAVLAGRPLLAHVIDHLIEAGIRRIVFIVGYQREVVRDLVEKSIAAAGMAGQMQIQFAEQKEQLGTGHAFLCASDALADYQGPILVASGDQPMIQGGTFRALLDEHTSGGHGLSLLTTNMADPTGYGRIIRDADGQVERNIEEKDATDEIREIREVNIGTYVFEGPEIFTLLRKLGSNNAQGEYYLPDALGLNREAGRTTGTVTLTDSTEAQGINSPVELKSLEEKLKLSQTSGLA